MMRIYIEDSNLGLTVEVNAGGGYAPDVMNDLQSRATDTFQRACAIRLAMAETVEEEQ